MLLESVTSLADSPEPLVMTDVPTPQPREREILIRVTACGVCHTELDEIEGRAPPSILPVIPGHEIVGRVTGKGDNVTLFNLDDRVGVGWISFSSGNSDENISDDFVATGRDTNGGYAEYMTVNENYAYSIPDVFTDVEAAPLLCAGGVGYRALSLAKIENGSVLGLTGFGGSGHLVLQLATYLYPDSPICVFARDPQEQEFALDLGATWCGDIDDAPPLKPHAIIDTTPVWRPVLASLKVLRPGGRLIINAIRKEDRDKAVMAEIDYADHLWLEKEIKTVANVTGADIRSFLKVAAEANIKPVVQEYPLSEANQALVDLRRHPVRGAKVLTMD